MHEKSLMEKINEKKNLNREVELISWTIQIIIKTFLLAYILCFIGVCDMPKKRNGLRDSRDHKASFLSFTAVFFSYLLKLRTDNRSVWPLTNRFLLTGTNEEGKKNNCSQETMIDDDKLLEGVHQPDYKP
jgi:hypothetical protein